MKSLSQSPTDPDFVQNPYPFYDQARACGDLFHWEDLDRVSAVSHRAVTAILKDRRLGRAVPPERREPTPDHLTAFAMVEDVSMLDMEPPQHTRLRSLVLRAFTSRRIAALEDEIRTLAHHLIDGFPSGPFDLLDAYCQRIPVIVIARMLGVPEEAADDLLRWSHAMVAMYQARRSREIEDAANAAAADFVAFLGAHISARRKAPSDDLLSHLIAAEEAGEKLSTEELIGTVVLLLNAGHEATVHGLGNAVPWLLANGRPEITDTAVEECLRIDPPLHIFDRWVYEDIDLFGHAFRRGDRINLILGAANRDPDAYPDPQRFDPNRTGPVNTSFGAGIHFCVGAPLARLEMRVGLSVLMARLPELEIVAPPRFANTYHFHGLERLMVTA